MGRLTASIFTAFVVFAIAVPASAGDSKTVQSYYLSSGYYRQLEADGIRRNAESQAQAQVNQGAGYPQGGIYIGSVPQSAFVMSYGNRTNVTAGFYLPNTCCQK